MLRSLFVLLSCMFFASCNTTGKLYGKTHSSYDSIREVAATNSLSTAPSDGFIDKCFTSSRRGRNRTVVMLANARTGNFLGYINRYPTQGNTKHTADVFCRDDEGRTVLDYAILHKNRNVLYHLVDHIDYIIEGHFNTAYLPNIAYSPNYVTYDIVPTHTRDTLHTGRAAPMEDLKNLIKDLIEEHHAVVQHSVVQRRLLYDIIEKLETIYYVKIDRYDHWFDSGLVNASRRFLEKLRVKKDKKEEKEIRRRAEVLKTLRHGGKKKDKGNN